jgi:hypothetical protein
VILPRYRSVATTPDQAMTAHAEVGLVVEEDDAAGGPIGDGGSEQGAHDGLVSPGLADDRAPQLVGARLEIVPPRLHRGSFRLRPAFSDDPGGLALGVGIDDANRVGKPADWGMIVTLWATR